MYQYTLYLDGIEGESMMDEHVKVIDIDSVHQRYEAPSELDKISLFGNSQLKPAVTCQGVTVIHSYDKSTPAVLSYLTVGTIIEEGSILCYSADNQVFLTIGLKQLIIRRVDTDLVEDKAKVTINVSYAEIEHVYTPHGEKEAVFSYTKEIPFS